MSLTPEMIADGWIEHDGGPCPVTLDSRPEIMLADSDTHAGFLASYWVASRWTGTRGPRQVGKLPHRIIAYKPESPSHDQ